MPDKEVRMRKWFAAAALGLIVATGVAWGCGDWSDAVPRHPATASSHTDPYSTAEAQRHFNCEPTHWTSLLIVLE
jgi:hypothetical protein